MPRISRDLPPETVKRVVKKALGNRFLVSNKALDKVCDFLEDLIKEIAVESAKVTAYTKRKTILERDIEFVLEDIGKIINKFKE